MANPLKPLVIGFIDLLYESGLVGCVTLVFAFGLFHMSFEFGKIGNGCVCFSPPIFTEDSYLGASPMRYQ